MTFLGFIFLFAVGLPFLKGDDDDLFGLQDRTCMLMLQSFANYSATYTYCTISHARPITLCQECVNPYINVLQVYDDITHIESMGGQKCESELANLDRLQVFNNGFKYVQDLWNRADCDSCFVLDKKTSRPQAELTEFVRRILNASADHAACVAKYHNTTTIPDVETCKMCSDTYQKINFLYSSYKAEAGVIEFCMDIVDLINNTRGDWSDVLGCRKVQKNVEWTFFASTAGMALLPVLFYLLIFSLTTKKVHILIERKRWNDVVSVIPSSDAANQSINS